MQPVILCLPCHWIYYQLTLWDSVYLRLPLDHRGPRHRPRWHWRDRRSVAPQRLSNFYIRLWWIRRVLRRAGLQHNATDIYLGRQLGSTIFARQFARVQRTAPHDVCVFFNNYTSRKPSGKWPVSVLAGSWGLLAAYVVGTAGVGRRGKPESERTCARTFAWYLFLGVLPPALLYVVGL